MTQSTKKQPAFTIFHVVEEEGKEPIWHAIGAAWLHEDGKGITPIRHLQPIVPGREVFRAFEAKKQEGQS